MSFVLLEESQLVPPHPSTNDHSGAKAARDRSPFSQDQKSPSLDPHQSLSSQIESTTKLFEILSARSDIDHPICTECTELLLSSLQSRLAASNKERDAYISFLKSLNNNIPTASEISKAQQTLSSTKATESRAFNDLLALEKEKANLDGQIADLEAESLILDQEEQEFWRSRNAFEQELTAFRNERDALNAAYEHDARQLERLQRTNVYNDTFCIGHDGFFGTINGLRLGRLPPPQNVDWPEINAAWGQASLLLATVAEKLGFTFSGYRIKPMGSTSRIEKFESQASQPSSTGNTDGSARASQPKATALDLFSSGDLPLGRLLLHRRLDAGMVAFLECLHQLGEFVAGPSSSSPSSPAVGTRPPNNPLLRNPPSNVSKAADDRLSDVHVGPTIPYEIRKDKIGDVSIRLGVSQDEQWTRACKYTLTCCKFLLAHASNVSGGRGRGSAGAT